MKAAQKGFTIVELLVVVVVISILAAITIVSYTGMQARAVASSNSATAEQVATKAGLWNASLGYYPSYPQLLTNSISPTMPDSTWIAGGAAGPKEANLGSLALIEEYPDKDHIVSYVTCTTPNTGYVLYYDPTSPNTVSEIPLNGPAPLIYGYDPNCP